MAARALDKHREISSVTIKGVATWTRRCGILAATDVATVQIKGLEAKVSSDDLPWPTGDIYASYGGLLIDYDRRWIWCFHMACPSPLLVDAPLFS